ncbi:MAG: hypothetical protein WC438_00140 [Candidatus Pacearchaeota archaeon]
MEKIIKNNRKNISKIFSIAITGIILGLLLISGPANAFELSLSSDVDSVESGDKIIFTTSVNINDYENLPIDSLTLKLNGPEEISCSFDITGEKLDSDTCHNINIKKIAEPSIGEGYGYGYGYYNGYGYNFGYGYGYTEQVLTYEITVHTQDHAVGDYATSFIVSVDGKEFVKNGNDITITAKKSDSHSSSGNTVNHSAVKPDTKNTETTLTFNNLEDSLDNNDETINVGNTPKKSLFSRITGAVIGEDGAGRGVFYVIVFILGIAILSVVVALIRRR